MSAETTECPSCGHQSEDAEWCDNCGSPMTRAPAEGREQSTWFKQGDSFQTWCTLHDLHIEPYQGRALIEFQITEVKETSSVRHIFDARAEKVLEINGIEEDYDHDELVQDIHQQHYSIEELSKLLSAHQDETPEELTHLVRVPSGEYQHGEHTALLFVEDGSLTLEEYVLARHGQLEFKEIKEIFLALLDLCEQLHSHNYLYLRLSPWTLRVVQQRDSSGELVAGIGAEETFIEEDDEGHDAQQEATLHDDELPPIADDAPTVGQSDGGFTPSTDGDEDSDADELPEQGDEHAPLSEGDEETSVAEEEDLLATLDAPTREPERAPMQTTNPNFPAMRETTQLAALPSSIMQGRVSRALLDGGARFYRPDGQYSELPVVMGFSPTEMFGRTQVPLAPGYDIFSMGMILYYLTCGVLPPTSIYTRHTPAVPARHFRPDFPIGLQTVINRATRADIQERFIDFASMRESFERACELVEARIEILQRGDVPRIHMAVERHIGMTKKLRNPVNQDHVFGTTSSDQRFGLMVVADGVSTASYGSGDLASKFIADVARERWPELLTRYEAGQDVDEFEIIYSLLDEANQRIIDHVNQHHLPFRGNPHEVMGTTTLIAVIHNGLVTLGSLGDSRAYLQRGTSFEQITIDHNLWTLSILEGAAADQAISLPHSEALARCLGTFYVEDERLFAVSPQPDIFRFPIIPGDTLLLATDGLLDFAGANNTASEDNTLSVMLSEPNPNLAALELILLANRGGGGDNIGVGIARLM